MRVPHSSAFVLATVAMLFSGGAAFAQTATSPVTGARPGNVIGTDSSLPTSNAASNITSTDTRSDIAPRLPAPDVGDNAGPHAYLVAARQALTDNKTGAAEEALERAETRALRGNVLASKVDDPSQQPLVKTITQARDALAKGDKPGTIQLIDTALAAK
jgi:hypothetical protein